LPPISTTTKGNVMRSRIHTLACAAAIACLGLPAYGAIADASLSFNAPQQSLWGGGPSAAFGSAWGFELGPVGFSYNVGASSGTVSAAVNGSLAVDHATTLMSPGLATLSLDFIGTPGGGLLKSDLGAWLNVTGKVLLPIPIIDKGYGLNVNQGFTPQIGSTAAGMASTALTGAGIDLGVAKVGADFNIDQTDLFTPTALNGLLDYGLRGSGITQSLPFSIASSAGLDLSVPLLQSGTWDFAVRNLSLANSFSTGFDASLVLYEEHIDGIDWCYAWFLPYPCGFSFARNDVTLASIDLYDASPFALSFNTIASGPVFSVAVIPEPGTLPMLALGLAVLGAVRMHAANRRRKTQD
jgi:hypothetical protein